MTDGALGVATARRARVAWPMPLVLAALAAAPLMFAPQLLNDGDSFWHVATGEWMLDHLRIVQADPFSHSVFGRAWTAHEWLAELGMAASFRIAGWAGVLVLIAGAVGLLVFVVAGYLRRWAPPAYVVLGLLLMAACLPPSLLARPHVLAWPVMAIWAVGLLRAAEDRRRPTWALLPVMSLWANMHGSFVLGLGLMAPLALEAVLAEPERRLRLGRQWALFAAGAVLAACVTPHGLHGLVFPFELMGMQATPGIDEWRPADFSRLGGFEIALMALIYLLAKRGTEVPRLRLLLVLGLLHLALQHARHQPVAAILSTLALAAPLGMRQPGGQSSSRLATAGVVVALAAVAAARLATPQPIVDGRTTPVSALQHVPADLRRAPVFNDYGFGGYLIQQGVRPFIDGRADMYGDPFISQYDRAIADPAALRTLLDRYGVAWTILAPASPAVQALDRSPGWRRAWTDSDAVVHVRR